MTVDPRRGRARDGTMTLEFSLVLPILLMLSLGMATLGLGVSQFQLLANMAHEGARYGSVRGSEYQKSTGHAAATAADVYTYGILPSAPGFPANSIVPTVTWPDGNNQPGSRISVVLNYQWVPTDYLAPITMSSTSVMTISF